MSERKNKIGQDFTTLGLFGFALPAFFTNLFTQLFKSLDDALFISRFVGENALAGLNLLKPLISLQMGLSHLFSIGSSNISAKLMGEDKQLEAKQVFSRIVTVAACAGLAFGLIINIFSTPILKALGADSILAGYAIYHIRLVILITPITLVSAVFNAYYSTAGKPQMGMICSITNGMTNIILDIFLVAMFKLGVLGASIATAVGDIIVFFIGLSFFTNKKHEIYFVKPEGQYLATCLKSFEYALPQFVNSLSLSITTLYTNHILLSMIGSSGVAANAIITDIRAMLTSGMVGLASSCGPVVAYNFGSRNPVKLKKILTSVFKIWFFGSISLMCLGFVLKNGLINLFMKSDSSIEFYNLALFGLTIEIAAVPFSAGCVISSRMFIAMTNTKASFIQSVMRHLVGKAFFLTILPKLFDTTGIWLAVPVTEAFAFSIAAFLFYLGRDDYGYGKKGIAKKMV